MSIKEAVKRVVLEANLRLRKDVLYLIKQAYRKEKSSCAKQFLKVIIENAKIAYRKKWAICQDTGLPLVFLEVGKDVKLDYSLIEKINEGIVSGYKEGGFRTSTIDFKGKLSYTPNIYHIDFVKTSGIKITIMVKGFGSENVSTLKMFSPKTKKEVIDEFIIESVKKAGAKACPPYFIGIGIGGTSDYALTLAKKALLERLDKPNKDKELAMWEKELIRKINRLKIGVMGVGGNSTCLSVRIKRYPTHIAGLPVGVNISCHALRSASIKIKSENLL